MLAADEIVMKSQQISKMWETAHKVSYNQILTQTRTRDHIRAACQLVVSDASTDMRSHKYNNMSKILAEKMRCHLCKCPTSSCQCFTVCSFSLALAWLPLDTVHHGIVNTKPCLKFERQTCLIFPTRHRIRIKSSSGRPSLVVFTDLVIHKPKSLFHLDFFTYYTIVLSDIIQLKHSLFGI